MLLLVTLPIKSNTPPWVFFTFFSNAPIVPNRAKPHIYSSMAIFNLTFIINLILKTNSFKHILEASIGIK